GLGRGETRATLSPATRPDPAHESPGMGGRPALQSELPPAPPQSARPGATNARSSASPATSCPSRSDRRRGSPRSAPGEVEGRLEGRAREGEDLGEVLVAESARRLGAAQDVHELALPLELERQLADPPVFEQLPEDRV